MGWFGKKDAPGHGTEGKVLPAESASATDESTGIDFAKYDLDRLGADIRSIVDIPGAIGQVARFVLTVPVVVAIITWVVFSSRMATWALVPFVIGAFVLAGFSAAVIGAYVVARKRLDLVADASNRVVDVVGEMHADVMLVKDGHAGTSVQGVAIGLLENAIFPAVFGTITTTAETAMGPFGRFSSSITKTPMSMVQKSVISAVRSLPDREIGQLVSGAGDALTATPAVSAKIERLTTEYGQARAKVEGIVAKVSRAALRSAFGFTLVAAIPLVIWLALGWLLG